MKLTEEQRELIALIPKAIRQSKEYTDATKLVLGQIDFMHGTDYAEVNGYVFCSDEKMSEETGVSERQVRRVVKILVNEGLITTIRGNRTKEGKISSKYWLTDLYYELANRPKPEKCPPIGGQNVIKEKNVHLDIELEPELDIKNTQCIVHELENKIEKCDDMKINEELIPQSIKDGCEVLEQCDEFDYTQFNDIADMVHRDAQGGKKCIEDNKSKYAERNAWITRLFTNIQDLLDVLSKCYDEGMIGGKYGYAEDLLKYFNSGDKKVELGWFTEKQILKYQGYKNRYNALIEDRNKRFAGTHSDKDIEDKATVSNANIISTGTSDSDEGGGCAAPSIEYEDNMMIMSSYMSKDEIAQLSKKSTIKQEEKQYGKYDSVDEWLKAVDERLGLTTQEPMVSYNANINAMNYAQ